MRTLKAHSKPDSGALNCSRDLPRGNLGETNNSLDSYEEGEPSVSIEIESDQEIIGNGYHATVMEMDVIPKVQGDQGGRRMERSEVITNGREPIDHGEVAIFRIHPDSQLLSNHKSH